MLSDLFNGLEVVLVAYLCDEVANSQPNCFGLSVHFYLHHLLVERENYVLFL